LIGVGVFVADPGLGFPPGASLESTGMSRSGLLHFVFGGLGFYALIGASFVFARRFKSLKQTVERLFTDHRTRLSGQLCSDCIGLHVTGDHSCVLRRCIVGVGLA